MRNVLLPLIAISLAHAANFPTDVQPVFAKRCVMCHGGAQQLAGVRLDNAADAMKGGYSGPIITAGSSATSKLIERIASKKEGFRMPPSGPALSDAEVAALKAWVDEGAVWPAGVTIGRAATPRKSTHWAYQPLQTANRQFRPGHTRSKEPDARCRGIQTHPPPPRRPRPHRPSAQARNGPRLPGRHAA
jgi:cytochrome c551/c552